MLKRINHVGVVVEDLAAARKFVESLGMELDRELEVPEKAVKAAFYRAGDGAQIELIELTTEAERRRRLGDGNRARIEHIAIDVDDITATIESIRGLGVAIDSDAPVPVGPNLNVWTQAETSGGVQYQFVERDAV
jgi:methylmalonyl-CoA/ethylmalonyl-CoA epimerase